MASSPPTSPSHMSGRPLSAIAKPAARSSSRLSLFGKPATAVNGSKASDEDSRTAVKVAVRVRPPLKPTDPGYELIPQRFQRSILDTTSGTSLAIESPQGRKLFVFDRVFGPDVMQDGIWDYLSDSINAFAQGYNVSLLAYGQSGAGKSYTMGTSGPQEQQDTDMMGVVPRAATALFEKLDAPKGASGIPSTSKSSKRSSMSHLKGPRGYGQHNALGDRDWSLKASYVEIYNEQLRDLLVEDATPASERNNVAIREDSKGNILLTGLRQVEINSVDDLMNALNFGSSIRQTDATAINAKSSRSHAVFSLNLVQRKNKLQTANGPDKRHSVPLEVMTGQDVSMTTDSKLHFVDLAGSERLKNTGAYGDRAKEGISINAGLASLGKVISQLSSRQSGSHVSYRDSKLTRLLQDSLGGNAFTYMIACVTPAEFHLSETLNTVQYAQRARAIQSKPRIQQIDDGDKQAIIERLKMEVAFLREQIRSSERGGESSPRRATAGLGERSDRQGEREAELQNQLLDVQENYTALNQRHAKLISELARAREHEAGGAEDGDVAQDGAAGGDSATDRLNRSNSFAQAVEQVVLEYEKTIQTLEQSLSNTRGTLSTTETNLLEKETRCVYVETINTQLQTRLHKISEREANTESYLRDLESKLDGHTTGEEKNASIIMELRKELSRARESEASCEDYISTLEERLAEADQDSELMQREMERLEQVIERQRSLGKLDSLLYELDHVEGANQQLDRPQPPKPVDGPAPRRRSSAAEHSRNLSIVSRHSQKEEPIPEGDEDAADETDVISTVEEEQAEHHDENEANNAVQNAVANEGHDSLRTTHLEEPLKDTTVDDVPQSPAQSKYVADKLENVTQELFDLRVEHETTVDEYDTLHTKYQEALRKLSELEDAFDEARQPNREAPGSVASQDSAVQTRPGSFLSDTRSSDLKDGPRSSLSRSLSSELSSAMESHATVDTSNGDAVSEDDDAATTKPADSGDDLGQDCDDELTSQLERFKTLAHERETAERELAERYAQLETKHNEALDMVEELRTEVSRARVVEATSPRASNPVIRRKSSQNLMIDRAHRALASLRNIAAENLDNNSEVMQSFEINLNSAMHELHSRSERIQELEADIASGKKEMETKMTIISGLTRERSSMSVGPIDMSMVGTLRDQLEQNEKQLSDMREAHATREQELMTELEGLRETLPVANGSDTSQVEVDEARRAQETKITELQNELASWEAKHQNALESMETTKSEMCGTIRLLEKQLESEKARFIDARPDTSNDDNGEVSNEAHTKQQNLIIFLRSEIDEYKAIIHSNATRVAELEQAHAAAKAELDDIIKSHFDASAEATKHKELIAKLEEQITSHEQSTNGHEEGLNLIKTNHERELLELKTREQKGYEEQVEVLMSEHNEASQKLEADLSEARHQLNEIAAQVATALGQEASTEKLSERIEQLAADQKAIVDAQKAAGEMEARVLKLTTVNEKMMRDLETAKASIGEMLADGSAAVPASVVDQLSAVKSKMTDLENRSKKNSRLVEELEEQLQNNFDEVQLTTKRLSSLQSERNSKIEEANSERALVQAELDTIREEYSTLQARYDEVAGLNGEVKRANSNSTIRKSASHTSLPSSPPPAIPLPPLPNGTSGLPATMPSSPTSVRPPNKDNMIISQISEDQEARIQTIEKHLSAERQLTKTLEEALSDLEKQTNKVKADCDAWKKQAQEYEIENKQLKSRPAAEAQSDNRWSLHAVEEERKKRQAAEAARRQLEERMQEFNKSKKKKKGSLNCF